MVHLMVPVKTVPTVRCSAKVKYCTKERRWERISIGGADIRKQVRQISEPEMGSLKSPEK